MLAEFAELRPRMTENAEVKIDLCDLTMNLYLGNSLTFFLLQFSAVFSIVVFILCMNLVFGE